MKELEDKIAELATSLLDDDALFLVDVKVSGTQRYLVRVLLDGDHGVNIDQCAALSRQVGEQLEESDLIGKAYDLEITSPGVGKPLQIPRQYRANVGRRLQVVLITGETHKGLLEKAVEQQIEILAETKEKKKTVTTPMAIPFADIKEAKVLVSFK